MSRQRKLEIRWCSAREGGSLVSLPAGNGSADSWRGTHSGDAGWIRPTVPGSSSATHPAPAVVARSLGSPPVCTMSWVRPVLGLSGVTLPSPRSRPTGCLRLEQIASAAADHDRLRGGVSVRIDSRRGAVDLLGGQSAGRQRGPRQQRLGDRLEVAGVRGVLRVRSVSPNYGERERSGSGLSRCGPAQPALTAAGALFAASAIKSPSSSLSLAGLPQRPGEKVP